MITPYDTRRLRRARRLLQSALEQLDLALEDRDAQHRLMFADSYAREACGLCARAWRRVEKRGGRA